MRVARSGALAAAAVLLALGVSACGSSGSSTSTTTTGAASSTPTTAGGAATTAPVGAAGTIAIHNFAFQPNPATAKVGDTITIQNQDNTAHTVTADDGSFDTKPISGSGMATIKVTKAGTISFHCNIHQFMTGKITVSA